MDIICVLFFYGVCLATTEPNKVIYSMIGVSKSYDKKIILKDI